MRIEIIPAEGGQDAARFATELGDAIAKHTRTTATQEGRTVILERL